MNMSLCAVLRQAGIRPVLFDIGSSGGPPSIWEAIAAESFYVGFDPDQREMQQIAEGRFHKMVVVNKAVTDHVNVGRVDLNLTKSPYCSSTLKPDTESLKAFLFSDLFNIEKTVAVEGVTIDALMEELSLSRIDWFKTDSQGVDLRLLKSIRENVRERILAVDIEPGLIDAYEGEDLFVDAHRDLTRNGFWLSRLNVEGAVRMRNASLQRVLNEAQDLNRAAVENGVRRSPAWCEARYLRTLEWLASWAMPADDYVREWVFAMVDGQFGFAIEIALVFEERFGQDVMSGVMRREAIQCIRQANQKERQQEKLSRIKAIVLPLWLRRWVRSVMGATRQ
jgi:FkbM family methyltransferase